jgi:hypothetical protein
LFLYDLFPACPDLNYLKCVPFFVEPMKLVSWEEGGYKISDYPMPRGEVVVGGHNTTKGYRTNYIVCDIM